MILPSSLMNKTEWVLLGPMGPLLPEKLLSYPLMTIDGGARFANKSDVWVGDADSFSEDVNSPHVFRHSVEKDQSDLALGLGLLSDPLHYKLHLWGFLGGRRDHELFNLGESLNFLNKHEESQILFYNEKGKIIFHLVGAGNWKFTHIGLFSLGCLKKTEVKLTGECQYPIRKTSLLSPLSSFGLSNRGHGEIHLETEGPLFLYFPEGE